MGCPGCKQDPLQLKEYLFQLAKGGLDIASCLFGEHVSEKRLAQRLARCTKCTLKDSSGDLLYRVFLEKYHTCGSFRLNNVLRDEKLDGCGCVLEIKAAGIHMHCPYRYW
jgi:hypothetical protein